MAISTYAELQQSIADYTHRADLAGVIPDFIRNAEARFNRTLRTQDMERRVKSIATGEYHALPNDYLELRNIQINANGAVRFLTYVTPQQIDQVTSKQTGETGYFTIIGNEFQFSPAPVGNTEVEIDYYQRIPVLGSTIQGALINTNWLLTKHPDAYLYGSLLQAEAYGYKDMRLPLWKQAYDEAVSEINLLDERTRWGGGAMQMRRMA